MTRYSGVQTDVAAAYRSGAPDAYECLPERAVSAGPGHPCRHCLSNVPAEAPMLILAHRPFEGRHPYAETGPIFLCAEACAPFGGTGLPPVLTVSDTYLVKAYGATERIIYGTGAVVPKDSLAQEIGARLEAPGVAFVDIRSARNNCWLARARAS